MFRVTTGQAQVMLCLLKEGDIYGEVVSCDVNWIFGFQVLWEMGPWVHNMKTLSVKCNQVNGLSNLSSPLVLVLLTGRYKVRTIWVPLI